MMPFTVQEFFDVFARYNQSVWPAQWALLGLAVGAAALAWPGRPAGRTAIRAALGILALQWGWMGIVYHFVFFRVINPAATIFALLFVIEAVLLMRAAATASASSPGPARLADVVIGASILIYALCIYPLVAVRLGHRYPAMPTFGLPCPTTIFTLGLLVWMRRAVPRYLLVVPLLWSIVGGLAAAQLGVIEDVGLPVAATLTLLVLARARSGRPRPHRQEPREWAIR